MDFLLALAATGISATIFSLGLILRRDSLALAGFPTTVICAVATILIF